MKAVVCHETKLRVTETKPPVPGKGQVLLNVLRCGICGSDLHAKDHCNHWSDLMARSGYKNFMRTDQEIIMGHEFCGEVADHGPGCNKKVRKGARVVALPMTRSDTGPKALGFSTHAQGAYAEQVVVEESMMMPVPNGLSDDLAALTEPLAVGLHAVRRSNIRKKDVAVVVGCGPVGLTVISHLKALGVKAVIASDFSPGRRSLAMKCGADVVVDPAQDSPFKSWKDYGFMNDLPDAIELAISSSEKMRALPVPWWHVWRLAEKLGLADLKAPFIFECVGAPGVLNHLIDGSPLFSRIVVVGVCMAPDRIEPAMAIQKEIALQFVLGYTPLEYHDSLHMIAEGKVIAGPLLTGIVGLDGVSNAFDALRDPEAHAKILIDPRSTASQPVKPVLS